MIAREATNDPRLGAAIRSRIQLLYDGGADPLTDRPAHVRAASGLARVNGEIALVQDDANFVAVIDPDTGGARAIAVPAGEDGVRQFHDERGNTKLKLDLEACTAVTIDGDPALLAFGSGSLPRRESVACVRFGRGDGEVRVVPLPDFYARLRRETSFAGGELNIEAVVVDGERLRLFNRGNGRATGVVSAVNATCEVDLSSFLAHLDAPGRVAAPTPSDVIAYDLGRIAGVRLGFTDAAVHGALTFYSAAAEASPDAVEDGVTAGSAIGVIYASGRARWAAVTESSGAPFAGKIEGILIDAGPTRLLAVIDVDDPNCPSELCSIELTGPWD